MATHQDESVRKKFSNWLQSAKCLEETKKSLHDEVLLRWKDELISWDVDEKQSIQTFLKCVADEKFEFKKQKNRKKKHMDKWLCNCIHQLCQQIFKRLLLIQTNPGSNVIWNTTLCENIAKGKEPTVLTTSIGNSIPVVDVPGPKRTLDVIYGPSSSKGNETTGCHINYDDIFEGCKEVHVWCLANMFMQLGTRKDIVINTGPENTDASMFFKMMKNCKLFDLKGENRLYDEVIECRNRLHHSSSNSIPRSEAEAYFKTLKELLEQFDDVEKCQNTIDKINRMLKETILCISVPDDVIDAIAKDVLQLKHSALEVDRELERGKGFSSEGTDKQLEDTSRKMKKAANNKPVLPEVKKYKDPNYHLEAAINLLRNSPKLPKVAEGIELLNTMVDEIVEEVADISTDTAFKTEAEKVMQMETVSKDNPQQQPPIPNSQEEPSRLKIQPKNPKKQLELLTSVIVENIENPHIAPELQNIITMMTEKVEAAAEKDPNVKKSKENLAKLEEESKKNEDSVPSKHVPITVKEEQTYGIRRKGDKGCDISGCCQLTTGEVLLVDYMNKSLKKLNDKYQIVDTRELEGEPYGVSCIDNSRAVVSFRNRRLMFLHFSNLKTVEVIETKHPCLGLASCPGRLFVATSEIVYLYNFKGKQQTVLFENGQNIDGIAAADTGSEIYIAAKDKVLIVNESGEILEECTDSLLQTVHGICMYSRKYILLCDKDTQKILQISSDGKILGTICENIKCRPWALCYNQQKSMLLCAGDWDYVTVLELR